MACVYEGEAVDGPITLDQYLHTSFRPDRDFVDGRVEDRLMGWHSHSTAMSFLMCHLSDRRYSKDFPYLGMPSLRTRVAPTRVRCPDICVIPLDGPHEQILSSPPLAVFEVLEPEDRLCAMLEKLGDFERFGVKHIWAIDPDSRVVYRYASGVICQSTDHGPFFAD